MEIVIREATERGFDHRFLEMLHSPAVPPMEQYAETKAGELVKAVGIIVFRYSSYGEMVGGEFGTEYVNPAARFIQEIYPDTELAAAVKALWSLQRSETYRTGVILLTELVMDLIEKNPEMLTEENEWDCLEFDGPEDRRCEAEEEDEEEQRGVSLRDQDLAQYPPLDWRR